ncbi:PREDICTED: uncharacterized protein LOC109235802 [Nicotiana attenuata]|uniref:uncharacterized protein LOC109235802 n=1 Tax=Nicotiana attenuata TaxID=49451 RepID=UPI0009054F68|nr:PREDICTED: uncharacterized protein LOC109235802 [Nicotiana attenuata]
MAQANLPISYWGDALLTATFVLNRVPTKSVTITPYELWTGRQPDMSVLRPWGCAAYTHDSSHKYGKLGPRGKKCIFIRYSETLKGYVFIGQQESGSVIEFESRDVPFLEDEFPKKGEVGQDLTLFEIMDQEVQGSLHSSGRILAHDELVSHRRPPSSSDANESNPSVFSGSDQMDLVPSGREMVTYFVPSGSMMNDLDPSGRNIDPNGNNDESQIRRGSRKKIPRR